MKKIILLSAGILLLFYFLSGSEEEAGQDVNIGNETILFEMPG